MSSQADDQPQTVTITVADLEGIIQRAVRTAVREELRRLLHEGPADPAGDAQLLQEALEALVYIDAPPETVQPWYLSPLASGVLAHRLHR